MKQLSHYEIDNNQKQFPITIVCDAIRTPENIGMCFRISESFGIKKIYFHESSPNTGKRSSSVWEGEKLTKEAVSKHN